MFSNTSLSIDMASYKAYTPDQLLPYVQAVSSVQSHLFGEFIIHTQHDHAIIIGYNLNDMQQNTGLETCIKHIMDLDTITHITVLAPSRPPIAPENAISHNDAYYFIRLPFNIQKNQNIRHMTSKALQNIYITQEYGAKAWTGAHQELMLSYIRRENIRKEMGIIFQNLGLYCKKVPNMRIFSAFEKNTNALVAFSMADFTSLHTAFYMFSMRIQNAPAGSSEALLTSLLQCAHAKGYTMCNLGLGINKGIRFFKEKWGAEPLLPFVETHWQKTPLSHRTSPQTQNNAITWLTRLFSRSTT